MLPQMNLTNHFLIAMPTLADPNFARTVTYVCSHDSAGAMGLVINRPMNMTVGDMLGQMGIDAAGVAAAAVPVLQGGPVLPERGFVLHRPAGSWDAVLEVQDSELGVATSKDILTAFARGEGPADLVVALGYAGWAAGQLEQEVGANAWLSGPADTGIIFDAPFEQRWEAAARLLGVDIERISGQTGHG